MSRPAAGLYDHIATLLASMGSQPTAVAATLDAEGVRGLRGSALAHPVCRWVARLVPDLDATLGLDTIQVYRHDEEQGLHGAIVPLPQPVRDFADEFDQGHHPDLELWMATSQPAAPVMIFTTDLPSIPEQPASGSDLPTGADDAPPDEDEWLPTTDDEGLPDEDGEWLPDESREWLPEANGSRLPAGDGDAPAPVDPATDTVVFSPIREVEPQPS